MRSGLFAYQRRIEQFVPIVMNLNVTLVNDFII